MFYRSLLAMTVMAFCATLAAAVPLTFLDDANALCLDGSKAGYYVRRGSLTQWMLYLDGGAWCWSPENCYLRSLTDLGSSTKWPREVNPDRLGGGPLSSSCIVNPTFCNFTTVFIRYCDGNSFAGKLIPPLEYNGTKLYLRGGYILSALLHQLLDKEGLTNGVDFILTGASAGGLATFLHSDDTYTLLHTYMPLLKRYGAMPIGGFFLDQPNILADPVYPRHIQTIFKLSNATHGVSSRCIQSISDPSQQWRCNFAEYVFSVSTVPTFVFNSKTDSWQVTCILDTMPFIGTSGDIIDGNCTAVPGYECYHKMSECSDNLVAPAVAYQDAFVDRVYSIPNFRAPKNGAFVTSCYTHCEAMSDELFQNVKIRGFSMSAAVTLWWDNLLQPAPQPNLYVDCAWGSTKPFYCNPGCGQMWGKQSEKKYQIFENTFG